MNIEGYEDRFILCRELRSHGWEPKGWDERPGTFGVARLWKCSRCGTERHDIYGARGVKLGKRYKYAVGYQVPRGEEAPKGDEWREEVMRRAGVVVESTTGRVVSLLSRRRKRSA